MLVVVKNNLSFFPGLISSFHSPRKAVRARRPRALVKAGKQGVHFGVDPFNAITLGIAQVVF
jgi:hypothetical protein